MRNRSRPRRQRAKQHRRIDRGACRRGSPQQRPQRSQPPNAAEAEPASANKPFKLGDLIEPFTPPPLAELDKTAEWIDSPVSDGMEIMREQARGSRDRRRSPSRKRSRSATTRRENNAKISRHARPPRARRTTPASTSTPTLVRHVGGDLKSSNPLLYKQHHRVRISRPDRLRHFLLRPAIWSTLLRSESVVSWQTSKDHMMDKIVIRDDLTWSDGKPITAHDVEFSFKVIMTEAVPIPAVRHGHRPAQMGRSLRRSHARVSSTRSRWRRTTATCLFPIIPKHIYEKSIAEDPTLARSEYHTQLEDHPVVGGPYELVEPRPQSGVRRPPPRELLHARRQAGPAEAVLQRSSRQGDRGPATRRCWRSRPARSRRWSCRAEQWASQTNGDDFYQAQHQGDARRMDRVPFRLES